MVIGNLLHDRVAAEKKVVGAAHAIGNEISKVEHEIVKDAKTVVAVPSKAVAVEHGIVSAGHAVANEIKALPG